MERTTEKLGIQFDPRRLAYIRVIELAGFENLPNEARAAVSDPAALYVLSSAEGEKLAIIEGREQAFAAAAAHQLVPMSVH
jgi:hypothetical protein